MGKNGVAVSGYDDAVTAADVHEWERDLTKLVGRISPLFSRVDSRRHAEQYLRGLLAPIPRKNGWTIAEYVGEREPKALQRFLNLTPWDADALLAVNRDYAMEAFSTDEGILVADPTGFAKKGRHSVGVQRQYSGTLGRIDNCQIATFLAYVTPGRDRVLIDRRLYLPEESWIADPQRCAAAGVPAEVEFTTRPEQVRDMIIDARAAGVRFSWFTADEEFGQSPGLRDFLETEHIRYVMAIGKNTVVTTREGATARIDTLSTRVKPTRWEQRACGIGTKGFRSYDWAFLPADTDDHSYMIRRSLDTGELAYYHCYTPGKPASKSDLVRVAGARWPIEECFAVGKSTIGLDNYQVRKYDAWHRHITLAMLAHTFLAVTAHTFKKRPEHRN